MENSPSPEPSDQSPEARPVPLRKAEPAPVAPPETRPAEAELRASDADREKIAELLRDAYAEGRLTVDEHAERIEAAYSAKTLGELAPLTRDLPTHQPIAPGAERPQPAGPTGEAGPHW